MSKALEQLRRETKDDARLYNCVKELYEQGVPFSELKALIPDIRRTKEQLHMKRMLENNNEVLLSMFSKEMSFLLDAKERQEEQQARNARADRRLRNRQVRRFERNPDDGHNHRIAHIDDDAGQQIARQADGNRADNQKQQHQLCDKGHACSSSPPRASSLSSA